MRCSGRVGGSGRGRGVIIGSGSSTRVYRGKFKNQTVALKMLFVLDLLPENIQSFYHEATLLSQLRHQHVVQLCATRKEKSSVEY